MIVKVFYYDKKVVILGSIKMDNPGLFFRLFLSFHTPKQFYSIYLNVKNDPYGLHYWDSNLQPL